MRIVLIFLLFQLTLLADSFFVRYNPSVPGNGTSNNPWGTLDDIDWRKIPDSSSVHLLGTFKQTGFNTSLFDIPNQAGRNIVFKAWDLNNKPVFDGNGRVPSRFGVEIRKGDNLTFQDITFKNFTRNPVFIQGTSWGRVTGITVRQCTFDPLKINGYMPGGISYSAIFIKFSEDSHLDTNTINYVYDNPVYAQTDGVYSQDNVNNSYVGNTIHIKNSINDQAYHIDGIQSYLDNGLEIEKNSVINESNSFGSHQNRQGIYINTVKGLDLCNNNIVLEDGSSAIGVHPDKCFDFVKISNNTLINKSNCGQQLYIEFPEMGQCNEPKSFEVYNNIFYKEGNGHSDNNPVAVKILYPVRSLIAFDNNLYYNNGSPGEIRFEEWGKGISEYHDFSSWKQSGRDQHGNVGNPNFAPVESFEYTLTEASVLAVDKGSDNMDVMDDFLSQIRPQGNGFDLGAFEFKGIKGGIGVASNSAESVSLGNYPNPFNPQTMISFNLSKDAHVKLIIYDILGQVVSELVNAQLIAGKHSVAFNASGFASGVYVYRIEIEEVTGNKILSSQKMIVNK